MTLNVAFVLGLPGATPSLECLLTFRTLDPSLASLLSWFFSRLTGYGQEEEKGEGEAGPFLVRPRPVVGHNTSPHPPWARTESLPCGAARDARARHLDLIHHLDLGLPCALSHFGVL